MTHRSRPAPSSTNAAAAKPAHHSKRRGARVSAAATDRPTMAELTAAIDVLVRFRAWLHAEHLETLRRRGEVPR